MTHGNGRSCPSSCRHTRSRSRSPGRRSARRSCTGCVCTRWHLRKIYMIGTFPNLSLDLFYSSATGRRFCLKCCTGRLRRWITAFGFRQGTHWGHTVDPPSPRDRSTGRSSPHRCRSLRFHRDSRGSRWYLEKFKIDNILPAGLKRCFSFF